VPKKVDSEKRDRAVRAVRDHGLSLRAAGQQVGVSATTVQRWIDAAGPAASAAPLEPAPEPAAPPAVELEPADEIRAMIRQFQTDARAAREVGNHTAASALMGHASKLVPTLARLDRLRNEDSDVVRYSKAEVAAAQDSVRATLEALAARPLCCARCGRELSAEFGGLAKDARERLMLRSDLPGKPRKL
jgi:transposase-like protein